MVMIIIVVVNKWINWGANKLMYLKYLDQFPAIITVIIIKTEEMGNAFYTFRIES